MRYGATTHIVTIQSETVFQALSDEARIRILRLMVDSGEEVCLCELVDCLQEPQTKLSRHLKVLRQAGLLDSKRGAHGGYFLIKRKRDISLHEVIEALEGRLALTECADDQGHCDFVSHCYMSAGMRRVNQVISQALQNVTISEIMDDKQKINVQIKS